MEDISYPEVSKKKNKKLEKVTATSTLKTVIKSQRTMKRQDNVTTKDHDNHSVMEPKDKETRNLLKREFKVAVLRKLNELQENTHRQFNEI